MSKVVPIVVILASIGSLFFAYKISGEKGQLKANIAELDQKLEGVTAQLSQEKQQTTAKVEQVQKLETDLAAVNQAIQETKAALDQQTQEAQALKTQLASAREETEDARGKLAKAEETLQKIQDATKVGNSEDVNLIREKLAALGDENKLLGQQLASLRVEKLKLEQQLRERSDTPVGARGTVAFVEKGWNFLVIDIGQQKRVQPNSQFLVYRDSKMIGKVQVVSVGPTTSVAEILPEYSRGTPRPGDTVIH